MGQPACCRAVGPDFEKLRQKVEVIISGSRSGLWVLANRRAENVYGAPKSGFLVIRTTLKLGPLSVVPCPEPTETIYRL